jgi:peptide/nickel transport system substrate-binding protein
MVSKQKLFSAMVLAGLCLILAGVPAVTPALAQTPQDGGTIIVGLQAEPATLDPPQLSDYNTARAVYNMYDGLLKFKDESTEVEPGLAESWEISADGLEYTLHLRQGVKFHDGTPFNAESVKFNLERQFDVNHPYHNTGDFAYADFTWGSVKQVDVVDEYTVKITLKNVLAPFISHLAMHPSFMVSPDAIKKYGRDISTHPVGTGPFKFVSWTPGAEVVEEKNPDYWGTPAHVDQLIFRPIIEDQAASISWLIFLRTTWRASRATPASRPSNRPACIPGGYISTR